MIKVIYRAVQFVLIETYWNVKFNGYTAYLHKGESINRNILECKVMNAMIALVASFVLIETYWNVKANGSRMISATLPVLIETYWNVKWCATYQFALELEY